MSDYPKTTHPGLAKVRFELARVDGADGDGPRYRVTCTEIETGIVVGRRTLLPAADGGEPVVDGETLFALMGGGYRLSTIVVDELTRILEKHVRKVADGLRLRKRLWRRKPRKARPGLSFVSVIEAKREIDAYCCGIRRARAGHDETRPVPATAPEVSS